MQRKSKAVGEFSILAQAYLKTETNKQTNKKPLDYLATCTKTGHFKSHYRVVFQLEKSG